MLGGWEEENEDADGAWSLVLLWDWFIFLTLVLMENVSGASQASGRRPGRAEGGGGRHSGCHCRGGTAVKRRWWWPTLRADCEHKWVVNWKTLKCPEDSKCLIKITYIKESRMSRKQSVYIGMLALSLPNTVEEPTVEQGGWKRNRMWFPSQSQCDVYDTMEASTNVMEQRRGS